MIEKDIIELAVKLHGHLAPGIALGLRMSEIAMEKLDVKRGYKRLIGISETSRCLADAMQAATGCTLGHGSAFVEDYGKLALTISNTATSQGVRIALINNAHELSPLMEKWMMRLGKLSHAEEDELGYQLLEMDERYLNIRDVVVDMGQDFESSGIVECTQCGDLIPEGLAGNFGETMCKVCSDEAYYRIV